MDWEQLGQRWLKGEVTIAQWQGKSLTPKQIEFVNSKDRFILMSGGMASGKTTAFIIKLLILSLCFPNNRILLGRASRAEVERTTLPDFFDLAPEGTYEYKVGPGVIKFHNGSEIILFGLEALQSSNGQDIKKAEQAIKGLNLGGFFIDQLEEVEERVFTALTARMRRDVPLQQSAMTCNPANFWAYDYFKLHPRPNTKLMEISMLDNKANLSQQFIDDMMSKPERWKRKNMYGEWSPATLTEGAVFDEEHLIDQRNMMKDPIRKVNGINIFSEPTHHRYQIGIDPSEGSVDPSSIVCVDMDDGEVVATYNEYVPIVTVSERAVQMALMYAVKEKPLLVPEVQGGGGALIEQLKTRYDRIYEREVFIQRTNSSSEKLGFHTNRQTKELLIANMTSLFDKRWAKLRDKRIVDELSTFIWSDEAKKRGAGAQQGFHDDNVMAMMLAYWKLEPTTKKEKDLLSMIDNERNKKQRKFLYV